MGARAASGGSVTLVASGAITRAFRRCAGAVGSAGPAALAPIHPPTTLLDTTQGGAGGNGGTGRHGLPAVVERHRANKRVRFARHRRWRGRWQWRHMPEGICPWSPRGRWRCGRQWRDGRCASQRRRDHGHSDFRLRRWSRGSMSMQMAATAVLAGWPAQELAQGAAMAAMAGVAEPPAPPSWAR